MTDYNHDNPQGEQIFEDVVTDAEFVESDPAEPTLGEKLDDTVREDVDRQERPTPDQLGENFKKIANEAAYAAVGFAGLVGDKAKEFYEEQRRQYAQTHPDADRDPGAKDFLAQLREKIDHFVEELTKGYKDMAERGRSKAERPADYQAPSTDSVSDTTLAKDSADLAEGQDTNYPE